MTEKLLSERMEEVFALPDFPKNIVTWIGHWQEEVAQLETEVEGAQSDDC